MSTASHLVKYKSLTAVVGLSKYAQIIVCFAAARMSKLWEAVEVSSVKMIDIISEFIT
jgi:hypothetical protein